MADLNDDIKKYLKGELSPAEMHALEKKALNDPFLEDALAGAAQLDANVFDSDVKNLRSSLEQRLAEKSGETVSVWVWPMRIAAGLILVVLSTFVIVKLAENKTANDLALQREAPESSKSSAPNEVAPDSATLSGDVVPGIKTETVEPSAKPAPAERQEYNKQAETEETKADNGAGHAITANTDPSTQAEKETSDQQRAVATEAVPEEQPAQVAAATEKDGVAAKKSETERSEPSIEEGKRRLANVAPATPPKAADGFVNFSKVITGRVVSEDGFGLPGVNVMFKNTNIGTVTDASGNYELKGTENNPSLVFSYIGFTSEEVAAGDKDQVNIELKEDVSQLSEIVVVGYVADKKSDDDEKPETLELANPYGGRRAYKQYLEKSMRYPEQALANGIEGKVTIQFTVESSGLLSNFNVVKGIGHGCEEEVIRLVQQGPKWNPTRRNTESLRDRVKVRMKFTLPKK